MTVQVRCSLPEPRRRAQDRHVRHRRLCGPRRRAASSLCRKPPCSASSDEAVVFVAAGRGQLRDSHRARGPQRSATGSKFSTVSNPASGSRSTGAFVLKSEFLKAELAGTSRCSNAIIDFHLDHPWFVLVRPAPLLIAFGRPRDAQHPHRRLSRPDQQPGGRRHRVPRHGAVEVEQLVTFPIESAMMGLPDTEEVRSISKLGPVDGDRGLRRLRSTSTSRGNWSTNG